MAIRLYSHLRVLFLVLCCLGLAPAQQKPPVIKLEDPELYFAFIRAHNDVDVRVQALSASDPARAQQTLTSTAAIYGVSAADVPRISEQVRGMMAQLAKWETEVKAYNTQQSARRQLPDMKTLLAFQAQRQRLVIVTRDAILRALPQASWSNLYSYINGDFQRGLRP